MRLPYFYARFYYDFFLLLEFWEKYSIGFCKELKFIPFRFHRRRIFKQNKNTKEGGRTLLRKKENILKKLHTSLSRLIAAGWPTPKLARLTQENKYANTMRGHHWRRKRREFFHV